MEKLNGMEAVEKIKGIVNAVKTLTCDELFGFTATHPLVQAPTFDYPVALVITAQQHVVSHLLEQAKSACLRGEEVKAVHIDVCKPDDSYEICAVKFLITYAALLWNMGVAPKLTYAASLIDLDQKTLKDLLRRYKSLTVLYPEAQRRTEHAPERQVVRKAHEVVAAIEALQPQQPPPQHPPSPPPPPPPPPPPTPAPQVAPSQLSERLVLVVANLVELVGERNAASLLEDLIDVVEKHGIDFTFELLNRARQVDKKKLVSLLEYL